MYDGDSPSHLQINLMSTRILSGSSRPPNLRSVGPEYASCELETNLKHCEG